MKIINRIKVLIICSILFVVCVICLMPHNMMSAEASNIDYSDERYTENDNLLTETGESPTETIQTFADVVNSALYGASIEGLECVIPTRYLYSDEENAVYKYNGKEYGFYVVKEGNYFTVLLIDFIYEFRDSDHTAGEYVIKIKPLVQDTFLRVEKDDGTYKWKKQIRDFHYTYYVANPRFLTMIENENAYNVDDSEYLFDNDEGLVISQSRVNYGKISYITAGEFVARASFNGIRAISKTVKTFLKATSGKGIKTIIQAVVQSGYAINDLYNTSKEVAVLTDGEEFITTNKSKTEQREIGTYVRAVGFTPSEEVILSRDDDSYAEFITLLNDTNYKTRISQYCEFDIVRRYTPAGSIEKVDEDYQFYKEQTLFEDKAPYFEISENSFENDILNLYVLPNGYQ